MSEETKIQIKLSRPALERLLGDDVSLETVVSHQVIENIVERYGQKLADRVSERVAQGLDLEGSHVAYGVLNEKIRTIIATEVGNYLRCGNTEIRTMVQQEVEKQLPVVLKSAVSDALKKAAQKVLATT
jgi:predicted RNA-binding protein (virulence factor B family)